MQIEEEFSLSFFELSVQVNKLVGQANCHWADWLLGKKRPVTNLPDA